MSLPRTVILPLARAYAAHAGVTLSADELSRRLEDRLQLTGPRSQALAAAGALFVRWAAPLFLLGRPRRFDGLAEPDAEALLARLQCARGPVLRGLFLGIKPILAAVCYG